MQSHQKIKPPSVGNDAIEKYLKNTLTLKKDFILRTETV